MTRLALARLLMGGLIIAMVAGLTLAAAITPRGAGPAQQNTAVTGSVEQVSASTLSASIGRLQRHLREQPNDGRSWAVLGLAYVERARTTADSSYYPKAQGVLDRSLQVAPDDNDTAYAGLAALAAARHDFSTALKQADKALSINPYGARALSSRVDALVELGRYDDAMAAARKADAVSPGIPAFTRLAYVNELRGRTGETRRILNLATRSAVEKGDLAYIRARLGELSFSQGDYRAAGREFDTALKADPTDLSARIGRARVLAATGDLAGAVKEQENVVSRAPLPANVTLLGEFYEAQKQPGKAQQQYAVAGTWAALAKANGVTPDLETALYAADHGDKATALRAAQAEWKRRKTVHVADALGWALHVNGRDKEAFGYARKALRQGYKDATFLYHLGVIEKSLGKKDDARRDLAAALKLSPAFSVYNAPLARAALDQLGSKK